MPSYLLDTNLLLRLSGTPSPQNPVAARALANLFGQSAEVFVTAQNLIEFWAVATRPVEVNGFGWNLERTRAEGRSLIGDMESNAIEIPAPEESWDHEGGQKD